MEYTTKLRKHDRKDEQYPFSDSEILTVRFYDGVGRSKKEAKIKYEKVAKSDR